MIIYQFSNSTQVIFMIIFSIVLLIGIIASFFMIPLLKLVFQSSNPVTARILLFFVNIIIYIFLLTIIILSVRNIIQYHSLIIDTDINNCAVTTGEIQAIEKTPQYARGADLTSYHLKCTIDGVIYYIDTGVGIPLENIDFWSEGDNITIYFRNIEGKNIIIRAIRN